MQDITVSSDELTTLFQIVHCLMAAADGTQGLDDAVVGTRELVAFEKGVVLHQRAEEPGAIVLTYEFAAGRMSKRSDRFRGAKALDVEGYLKCLSRTEALQNAFFWHGCERVDAPAVQGMPEVLKQAALSQGVAGAARGGSDGTTLIQLQHAPGQFTAKHLFFVNLLVAHLHGYFDRRAADFYAPAVHSHLTSKEKEVLQWVTLGKTSIEVGTILSMSERTVKFHLRNIYAKLNVVNRAQAATIASRLKLI